MKKLIEEKVKKFESILTENQMLMLKCDMEVLYMAGKVAGLDKSIEIINEK